MVQLAAQQEMIRRGLQEVQQSMGNQSDVLGRLDRIAKDMDDVTQQLRSHDLDPRILERQQRILSHLLTAQRSLHKEGETQERQSQPALNPQVLPSPPPIEASMSWQEALRRGILRGSQDPVPDDYHKLVESYFRSLGSHQ